MASWALKDVPWEKTRGMVEFRAEKVLRSSMEFLLTAGKGQSAVCSDKVGEGKTNLRMRRRHNGML